MPSSVLQEETKIDCLPPEGVSYNRLVFHGIGHKCLFSRGPSLNVFQIVFTECPVWDSGGLPRPFPDGQMLHSAPSPHLSVLVATAALLPVPRGQGWVRLMGDSVGENQLLLSALFLLDG